MTLILTYDPDLQSPASYGYVKAQGQRSVGSEHRMKTNGQTERHSEVTALPPTSMRSVVTTVLSQNIIPP